MVGNRAASRRGDAHGSGRGRNRRLPCRRLPDRFRRHLPDVLDQRRLEVRRPREHLHGDAESSPTPRGRRARRRRPDTSLLRRLGRQSRRFGTALGPVARRRDGVVDARAAWRPAESPGQRRGQQQALRDRRSDRTGRGGGPALQRRRLGCRHERVDVGAEPADRAFPLRRSDVRDREPHLRDRRRERVRAPRRVALVHPGCRQCVAAADAAPGRPRLGCRRRNQRDDLLQRRQLDHDHVQGGPRAGQRRTGSADGSGRSSRRRSRLTHLEPERRGRPGRIQRLPLHVDAGCDERDAAERSDARHDRWLPGHDRHERHELQLRRPSSRHERKQVRSLEHGQRRPSRRSDERDRRQGQLPERGRPRPHGVRPRFRRTLRGPHRREPGRRLDVRLGGARTTTRAAWSAMGATAASIRTSVSTR